MWENLLEFANSDKNEKKIFIPFCDSRVLTAISDSVTQNVDFSFGNALENVYPLLNIIFEYLSWKELEIASQVCVHWKAVAQKIFTSRSMFTKPLILINNENKLLRSNNFYHHYIDFTLLFYDRKPFRLSRKFYYSSADGDIKERNDFAEYVIDNINPKNYFVLGARKIYFSPILDNGLLFASISFPKINGVRMIPFKDFSEFYMLQMIELAETEKLSGLLFFSSYPGHLNNKGVLSFLERLKPRLSSNFAFCGGVTHTRKHMSGVLIITDNSKSVQFETHSIVILEHEDTDYRLCKMKEDIPLKANSMAIMAQCNSRHQGEETAKQFQHFFPDVPLVGVDVNGEFGIESKTSDFRVLDSLYDIISHSYSISFMLLTWNTEELRTHQTETP